MGTIQCSRTLAPQTTKTKRLMSLELSGSGTKGSFRLNRFNRIKFPVYVVFGTQTASVQDTFLASIDTARRARDGK
jgi:hypothetical protein